MRSLLALALVAILVAIALLLSPSSDAPTPLAGPDAPQATAPTRDKPGPLELPEAPQREPESGAAPATPLEARPTVHLFGRVLDTAGQPLAQASIQLSGVGEPWLERSAPDAMLQLVTQTNGLGQFEITVPLPTAAWVRVRASAGAFYTTARRSFRKTGESGSAPLVAGDHDLGDLVLAEAGALEGRVTDATGVPIDRAYVHSTTSTSTDVDGRYRAGSIDIGTQYVSATKRGFQGSATIELEVRAGVTTKVPDLVLELAPTLEGHVLDENGAPIAGVQLFSSPEQGGSGSGALSDAYGAFSLPMAEQSPYRITAERDGFLPLPLWGSASEDAKASRIFLSGKPKQVFDAATRGIEIRLVRADEVTFHVVAASSGLPVESFGLATHAVRVGGGLQGSRRLTSELPVERHPGGVAVMAGNERNYDYVVQAPGFGPQRGRVVFDVGKHAEVTLRLAAAARIEGRLVKGADGLPMPSVTLKRARVGPLESDSFDLDTSTGRARAVRGGPDGRFALGDLAAGTYQLVLRSNGTAPLTIERVHVEAGETLDLGDLEVSVAGKILGRLIGAPSVEGISVSIGDRSFAGSKAAILTTRDGSFGFEGLAEGDHTIWVYAQPGVLAEDISRKVHLGPGEVRKLQLDLSPSAPFSIEAHVLINGQPREGLVVFASTSHGDHFPFVGTTDSEGLVRGEIPPIGAFQLDVRHGSLLCVGLDPEVHTATAGGRLATDLALEPGELSIVLPFDAERLEEPRMQASLSFVSLSGYPLPYSTGIEAADWVSADGLTVAPIGLFVAGTYDLVLRTRIGRFEGTVEVLPGESAQAILTAR